MLACEEMFLLLTDDTMIAHHEVLLRAALLADLLLEEAAHIDGNHKVLPTAAPRHPVLAWAVEEMRNHKHLDADMLLQAEWFSPRTEIAQALSAQGAVDVEEERWWRSERLQVTDPNAREELKRTLVAAINGTAPASPQAVILLSILREAGGAYTLLQEELEGLDRHEARERMDALQAEPELSDVQRTSLASVATVLAALS